jgi:protein-L-isoaspartate(D-aspartate) O-methyltransferase
VTATSDPAALRAALVETLRSKGRLDSPPIAEAFAAVPRHLFVPEVSVEEAYTDRAIPTKRLADGEAISSSSQPEIMAIMLDQLDVTPGHRVLEIGAGTGYNAALLARLVAPAGCVTSIDIDEDIVAAARAHLAAAGVTDVRVVRADGWAGDSEGAPYDRIILTVGAHDISPAWRAQLAPSGRLVLPLALAGVQASVAFAWRDGILVSDSVRGCMFMRLRGVAAVLLSPVTLGPEPAPQVWPRAPHAIDGAEVHDVLQGPGCDLPTDIAVLVKDLHDGLVSWLGLHEPRSAWITAHAKAMDGRVPELFGERDRMVASFGFFERNGVAMLARAPAPAGAPEGSTGIAIRVHGDVEVGHRLHAAVRAWVDAGSPEHSRLQIRAHPIDAPCTPRPGEVVMLRPCTRFVLDWA